MSSEGLDVTLEGHFLFVSGHVPRHCRTLQKGSRPEQASRARINVDESASVKPRHESLH